jgi:hypothetical protein
MSGREQPRKVLHWVDREQAPLIRQTVMLAVDFWGRKSILESLSGRAGVRRRRCVRRHPPGERFAVYIPNKDRNGERVEQAEWVDKALRLLSEIGGGATAMPPVTGAWLNPETQELIIEEPKVVYSYIDPELFEKRLPDLAQFVKRLGRETNQGAIAVEYGGTFFTVEKFD